MRRWRSVFAALTVLAATSVARGGETRIGGLAFGDAYYLHDADEALDGRDGFWFRRLYISFRSDLTESWSACAQLEANGVGNFTGSAKMMTAVKDLSLTWHSAPADVVLGMSGTPTFAVIEKIWGYRSVEKTPADLYKLESSRDIGVAVKGRLGEGDLVRYHAMLGNGSGDKSETDRGKIGMLSVGLYPNAHWVLEAYGEVLDWASHGPDRLTFQGFAAYQSPALRVGAHYMHQERRLAGLTLRLASAFAAVRLKDGVTVLARYDHQLDTVPGLDKVDYLPLVAGAPLRLVIVGLDVRLADNVSLIPNVEQVFYGAPDAGPTPEPMTLARLTLAWKY